MRHPGPGPIRGRGAADNPKNRFESLHVEPDPETEQDLQRPVTHFLRDGTRSVLTYNDSPDLPFKVSLNPYRGCEHGCSYCYARPSHEYLGYSAGLDFETRILVKEEAPEILREELARARWRPQLIAMSGITDPYQPVERRLQLSRRCLEVLSEVRNPLAVITKNHLVTRDRDLLAELSRFDAAAVFISITTLDPLLARVLEPRASHPGRRLEAIATLTESGVPVGVLVAPLIPALTDHELPAILRAAADAGARDGRYILLRLPFGLKEQFEGWLRRHFPDRADRVLSRIRDLRGGRLNDPDFGTRMRGTGVYAGQLQALYEATRRQIGMPRRSLELSTKAFRPPGGRQLPLF